MDSGIQRNTNKCHSACLVGSCILRRFLVIMLGTSVIVRGSCNEITKLLEYAAVVTQQWDHGRSIDGVIMR